MTSYGDSGGPDDLEQVEVRPGALEKALSSLMDQVPKDQRKATRKVGWLLPLMALKLQHQEILAREAKMHELQGLEEALEAGTHAREEVAFLGQEGPAELKPGDGSEDSVTAGTASPVLQA